MTRELVVRSNVRRDLLQSAQLFKNEKLVIWEYVSNSLQYLDPGVTSQVDVIVDSRRQRIVVSDNGRGMDLEGLQNYFVMHGENLDRLAGRGGRGRFGTGKSAAFGIGRRLRVTSVKDGKRSCVELTRDAIDAAGDDEIPLEVLESEIRCDEPNGTIVEIEEVQLRRLDPAAVVRYLERHLTRWRGRPSVTVNSHECEPHEPVVGRTKECRPDEDTAKVIGDVILTLKVATAPLDAEQQGVSVFAHGVWLSNTLAGAEGQPMANYIFGEIDVAALDDEDAPMPAFDMSRSMQLNPENEVVRALIPFVGREIDRLRRDLVREDRQRRAEAEAVKMQREADRIADLINEDFGSFRERLHQMRSRGGRGQDVRGLPKGDEGDFLRPDADGEPGEPTEEGGPGGAGGRGRGEGSDGGDVLQPTKDGRKKGTPTGKQRRQRPRGGFRVEFDSLGKSEPRARYAREERVIFVNLDHPQIRAARGEGSTDNVNFRRLAYEVAFCEYAIALASELASSQEYIDPTDPIFDIRETINRMAVRSASLYAEVSTSGA